MNFQQLQSLKGYIALTAAYYGQQLDDAVIAMYAEDLSDLPFETVKAAITEIRRNPSITRFPLPAVIRAKIAPPETDVDQARLAEAAIWEAVSRFGWPNGAEAEAYVGQLAWEGVKRFGGWPNVCLAANDQGATYRAQMRNLIETVYRASAAGRLEQKPSLPKPEAQPVQEIARTALRALPGGE